jgi:hypothetical protein
MKLAKKGYNDNIINCSDNKIETMWNIVKNVSNIKPGAYNINPIKINKYNYSLIIRLSRRNSANILLQLFKINIWIMLYQVMKIPYLIYLGHSFNLCLLSN